MAEIVDTSYNANQVPATPIKGFSVNTSEIKAPEYSPGAAPVYNATGKDTNADSAVFDGPNTSMMPPNKLHPILPIGDIVYDIRNHLSCHKNFNMNIETLMIHFLNLKKDLDEAREAKAIAERDLIKEREEKKAAQAQVKILERALSEALSDLAEVRSDLAATEQRLSLAITQLTETAKRLEVARGELRVVTKERDALLREVAEVRRQLQFQLARAAELQAALDIANAGENAANDRNTRLTELLYQIEASKASIERVKDSALARIRELELLNEQLRQGGDIPKYEAEILKLKVKNQTQVLEIARLSFDLREKEKAIIKKNATIKHLNGDVSALREDIRIIDSDRKYLRTLVNDFKAGVKKTPKRYWKHFPQEVTISSLFDYSTEIDNLVSAFSEHVHEDGSADEEDGEVHTLPVDETPVTTQPGDETPITTQPVDETPVKILPVEPEVGESSTAEAKPALSNDPLFDALTKN